MYKENAQAIIDALEEVKAQALRDSSVLMVGICSEVKGVLDRNEHGKAYLSWNLTCAEAFVCWPKYSGNTMYPVADLVDRAEYDSSKYKGYGGTLGCWQYSYRPRWTGRQLELRLSLIDHCIKFYTALRDS